jgi:hypothetical protein
MKKKVLSFLVLVGILLGFLVFIFPVSDCDNTACQLGEISPVLTKLQLEIESDSLSSGYDLNTDSHLYRGYVTSEGKIILVLNSGAVVIAKRMSNSSKDGWRCEIYPEKFKSLNVVKDCGKSLKK